MVCLIVALVDREVETKSTIDLNVNVPWTVEGVALLLAIRRASFHSSTFTLECSRLDRQSCLVFLAAGRTFSVFRWFRV